MERSEHMIYILMGVLAFLLFIAYDINSVTLKKNIINHFFFLGSLLLIVATAGIIIESFPDIKWDLWQTSIFGMISFIFLILLIYTLFFALPFKETYIKSNTSPKIYQDGIYALCRHPGFLWFTGFYFFSWLALKIPLLLLAGIIFSCCNFIYVIFQDYWTFIHIFVDYPSYKKRTPFIIPNFKSLKQCLQTL
ncbi:hypothetical protein [Acetobacterium woodii]|nr:hypothetical protein [Acetobacterium woodii]